MTKLTIFTIVDVIGDADELLCQRINFRRKNGKVVERERARTEILTFLEGDNIRDLQMFFPSWTETQPSQFSSEKIGFLSAFFRRIEFTAETASRKISERMS